MTRNDALNIARTNRAAYTCAEIAHLFKGAAAPVDADFGHSRGWFKVGDFNFTAEDMDGSKCKVQQSFAYL